VKGPLFMFLSNGGDIQYNTHIFMYILCRHNTHYMYIHIHIQGVQPKSDSVQSNTLRFGVKNHIGIIFDCLNV
jgi:hypothetical protein